MSEVTSLAPLAAKIGPIAKLIGVSRSTIRRRVRDDPDFPRPFTLSPGASCFGRWPRCAPTSTAKAGRSVA